MRIAIPHHTTKEKARKVIDEKLTALLNQFGGQADDVQHSWSGDTLTFKGKAKGFSVEGTMEVTDDQAILEAKLPFMARPFEPKISA
ncbi:MAG TPA: polyhydroxyalkanoic acid system family protein, partial [Thermoanaerobaculia bacterium]|nr:polyhydroxyalkanoic acid system family protein [Thermoanaerobaculia bacterium]